ncbi:MAG TPA: diguanylate cyclase, partial [Acidimicrobiales bacterium]
SGLEVQLSLDGVPISDTTPGRGQLVIDRRTRTETVEVMGRSWGLTFRPTPDFGEESDEWKSLVWAGTSSTLGAAAVVGLFGTQRSRLRRQVASAVAEAEAVNRRLEQEVSFQRALLANLQTGVLAVDAEGNLAGYNLADEGLFFGELPARHDGPWSQLLPMYTLDGASLPEEQNPMRLALNGERVRGLEVIVGRRGSAERIVHCNGQSIVNAVGTTLGAVVVMQDITALKRAEQRLVELAHQDPLTGLPNRTVLTEQTEIALLNGERTGHAVGLVFLDLDGFKSVNDVHGHDVGDELLRVAAARLQQAVRRHDLVSRLGGDEFVVLLRQLTPDDPPEPIVARIEASLRAPFVIGQLVLHIGVSTGLALAAPGDDAASLQRRADQAMYRTKANRRRAAKFVEY